MLGQAAKGKWGDAWGKGVQRPEISLGVGKQGVWDSPAALGPAKPLINCQGPGCQAEPSIQAVRCSAMNPRAGLGLETRVEL